MNFKTTLILIVLLAVVGGYLFFTRDSGADKPRKQEEHKLLAIDNSSDVSKLTIAPSGSKPTILQKSAKDWRLLEPLNAPADATEVNSLLDSLVNLKSTAQLDAKEAASARTGLDKPQFTVILNANNKETKLLIGDRMAVGNTAYAKLDGHDAVEVIPADLLDKLDRPAKAYRETKLIQTPSFDITQLTLARKNETIRLDKSGSDWQIAAPIKAPADSAAATDLINALTGIKAKSFIDDPAEASDAMKGPPQLVVTFATQPPSTTTKPTSVPAAPPAAKTATLTFGPYDDVLKENLYVRLSEPLIVARVPASSLESFNKKPLDLRDKKVIDINPDEVSRFSIASDIAAATQPTSRPAKKSDLALERRKTSTAQGVPFLASAATTHPTTSPADKLKLDDLLPKHATWAYASPGSTGEPDDSEVSGFLAALHPLRADKYVETNPTTQPSTATYTINVQTQSAGGAKSADHQIHIFDPGNDKPYLAQYNGLTFELSRFSFSRHLENDFKKKPGSQSSPQFPPGNGGGFPGLQ